MDNNTLDQNSKAAIIEKIFISDKRFIKENLDQLSDTEKEYKKEQQHIRSRYKKIKCLFGTNNDLGVYQMGDNVLDAIRSRYIESVDNLKKARQEASRAYKQYMLLRNKIKTGALDYKGKDVQDDFIKLKHTWVLASQHVQILKCFCNQNSILLNRLTEYVRMLA